MPTWTELAAGYGDADVELFSSDALDRYGDRPWEPTGDDRAAAGRLHAELASRIATQRLSYIHGVEVAALESIASLFGKTREIAAAFPNAVHFEVAAWDVLNNRVRPFTAKWHRKSTGGALGALDSADEFRAELAALQKVLRRFDELLEDVRDGVRASHRRLRPAQPVPPEAAAPLRWGIPSRTGGLPAETASLVNAAERDCVGARRRYYGVGASDADAVGLALSGGGIRSATFSLGVLVALSRRGLLPQVDFLSTVSGGGYLGSFLSAFLASPRRDGVGLRANELPFQRVEGEAAALRHVRHHSRFLAMGPWWQRLTTVFVQVYGMVLNGLAVVYIALVAAAVESWLRHAPALDGTTAPATRVLAAVLGGGALIALALNRFSRRWRGVANYFVSVPASLFLMLLAWRLVGMAHDWLGAASVSSWAGIHMSDKRLLALLGAIPVLTSAVLGVVRHVAKVIGKVLVLLATVSAPLFAVALYLVIYKWVSSPDRPTGLVFGIAVVGGLIYYILLDINATSLHGMYRDSLARAYLLQATDDPDAPLKDGVSIRLSELVSSRRAPYHLINAALNVPGSKNSAMQGRLTDFFLFSPSYSGSPLTGYRPTVDWEAANAQLDLASAMAISGGAAAPHMGLATRTSMSFWLALFNIRLDYWLKNPASPRSGLGAAPSLGYLLREMLGTMDERLPRLNVSDGGHIENLGVYELLRRRCKYIIAVDGEQDPKMTFHGLTTLQRLAAIDLGVNVDVDLDDLRLNDAGMSRSHFRLCRVHYPADPGGEPAGVGYLLYVKLTLTGNEGEFLRRYRLDEPMFPHHSTADQFFTETQFEAYRALGEHIGDKLFMRALMGDRVESDSVDVSEWFGALSAELLEPLRS